MYQSMYTYSINLSLNLYNNVLDSLKFLSFKTTTADHSLTPLTRPAEVIPFTSDEHPMKFMLKRQSVNRQESMSVCMCVKQMFDIKQFMLQHKYRLPTALS